MLPGNPKINRNSSLAQGLVYAMLGNGHGGALPHDDSPYSHLTTFQNVSNGPQWKWVPEACSLGLHKSDADGTDYPLVDHRGTLNGFNWDAFTLACWVCLLDDPGGWWAVMMKGTYTSATYGFFGRYIDQSVNIRVYHRGSYDSITSVPVYTNVPFHIAYTWSNGSMKAWFNGVQNSGVTAATGTHATETFDIGLISENAGGYDCYGTIARPTIWRRALSPSEIKAISKPFDPYYGGLIERDAMVPVAIPSGSSQIVRSFDIDTTADVLPSAIRKRHASFTISASSSVSIERTRKRYRSFDIDATATVAMVGSATGVATYYWIGSGTDDWDDDQKWSLISGGSAASATPGSSDNVIFDDGGTGDCTINVGVGSVAGSLGAYTLTPGIASITIESGYTGTISRGTSDFVVGIGGIDASGALDGCFNAGSTGYFASRGSVLLNGISTFTYGSATLIIDGGTADTRLDLDGRFYGVVINGTAFIDADALYFRGGGLDIHGDLTIGANAIYAADGGELTYRDSCVIGGSSGVYVGDNCSCVVEDGATIGSNHTTYFNTPATCSGAGNVGNVGIRNYGATGTVAFTNTGGINDLTMYRKNAATTTISFDDTPVYGDISESVDAVGSYTFSGTAVLSGDGQTLSVPNATAAPALAGTTTGTLTLNGGDFSQGAALGAGDVVISADSLDQNSYDFGANSVTIDSASESWIVNPSASVGGQTIPADTYPGADYFPNATYATGIAGGVGLGISVNI